MAIYSVERKPVVPFTGQISARVWLLLISMVERECGKFGATLTVLESLAAP